MVGCFLLSPIEMRVGCFGKSRNDSTDCLSTFPYVVRLTFLSTCHSLPVENL